MRINDSYIQTRNATIGSGRSIKYIVVHYTGNDSDSAKANAKYFYNNDLKSSAHYFVDESEIYRSVEDKNIAWHCGTSGVYIHSECRNANSIGVEMCTSGGGAVSYKTLANTARLISELLKKYSLNEKAVLRHYDVTRKLCPKQLAESEDKWREFLGLVKNGGCMKFNDITDADPAARHIERLCDAGIINGYSDGTFRPDRAITRREAAVIAANILSYLGVG